MLNRVNGSMLVLLSGGIDSSATVALYKRRPAEVSTLFVDYGQAAVAREFAAAEAISAHYAVRLTTVSCTGLGKFGAGYVRGRNALLLQVALAAAPFEVGQIAMGLHAGSSYPDCSPLFLLEMQRSFDLYCDGKIRAVAPFIDQDKRGVVAFCKEVGVPLALTYSCERGTHCGECLSCLDRTALDVG
jgi:7-cyano-7-deazaguanine synthase